MGTQWKPIKMGKTEIVVSLFKEFESSDAEWTSFSTQIYRILCESLGKLGDPLTLLIFLGKMKSKVSLGPSLYASLVSSLQSIRASKNQQKSSMEKSNGKKMLRDPAGKEGQLQSAKVYEEYSRGGWMRARDKYESEIRTKVVGSKLIRPVLNCCTIVGVLIEVDYVLVQTEDIHVLISKDFKEKEVEMGSSAAKGKQSCKYASNTYKGLCFFNRNCDIICKAEGAPSGGRCRILTLRCICNVCDPD
ncbi:pentatricopeptide repeat-containing protein [Tanacetum coccineum]